MGENVLVLGAGASFGARAGLVTLPPPLGNGLAGYLVRWLAANDPATKLRPFMDRWHHVPEECPHYTGEELWRDERLGEVRAALADVRCQEALPRSGVATPFELLMDRWAATDEGQWLLRVAHRVLVYAMNVGFRCAFPEGRDRYDNLIARFKPTVVVTVNYDTLTEEAILRASLRYWYPGLEGPRAPGGSSVEQVRGEGSGDVVPIFKLHGSVNWHSLSGASASGDLAIAERMARERSLRIVQRGPLVVPQTWATYASADRISLLYELEQAPETGEPVVAVYGTGKPLLENVEHVEQHRTACLDRLSGSSISRVWAVGIRPVTEADDPILFGLLQLLGTGAGEKVYVGPNDEEREEMRRRGFVPGPRTLAELVSR